MGQYHKLYNLDRKEYVHAHNLGLGLELMKQCGFEGSTADALWLLLANSNGRGGGDACDHPMVGRWAGHRIVVQGDYAEPGDRGFVDFSCMGDDPDTSPSNADEAGFRDISAEVLDMLNREFGMNRYPL